MFVASSSHNYHKMGSIRTSGMWVSLVNFTLVCSCYQSQLASGNHNWVLPDQSSLETASLLQMMIHAYQSARPDHCLCNSPHQLCAVMGPLDESIVLIVGSSVQEASASLKLVSRQHIQPVIAVHFLSSGDLLSVSQDGSIGTWAIKR